MIPPLVSFVVATYLRPDALQAALRGVLLQDYEHWELIVVGDCCGPETAKAIADVGDPRIRYYNLPERYGEQGGPNTAGMHLAGGEYIVFLNSAGEGAVRPFGDAHSVGARYFQRIRRIEYQPLPLDPPPGVTGLDSPAVTGLTSTSFSQSRSDWDTALLAYRNNVLSIKTPRT